MIFKEKTWLGREVGVVGRKLGIGHQNFETVRRNHLFYVDKTDFIRQWWENMDEVTLITRPRRFGKTLNMSMLEKFFSVRYAGRSDLFEGLKIWESKEYRALQGSYPVLLLSFADIKDTSFASARKKICKTIQLLYNEFDFLLEGNVLNDREKEDFRMISADMEDYMAALSLKLLSGYLYKYYGKKVILLLDEYDAPMQEAYVNGYWNEMVSFTRGLFNAAFKTNPYLERAVMTGITRVSRESVFSDLNNLVAASAASDLYADCFGFCEKEVFDALDEYGLSDKREEVRDWYDGFTCGRIRGIYNPWSVINYLREKEFAPFWANTSSNILAGQLIREGSPAIKKDFEVLLRGGVIEKEIDDQIVFSALSNQSDAVWSLLLAAGYLKAGDFFMDAGTGKRKYRLSLTNKEVRLMFSDMIRGWFSQEDSGYNEFVKALLADSLEDMNAYMNQTALAVFSSFDVGNRPSGRAEPERFYHGFVLGLIVELTGRYVVTSNRESGCGRYDVMLEPLEKEDPAIIMEFKVHDPAKENTLDDTVGRALRQIEEKQYETIFLQKGIAAERIKKYGFAFKGKKVLIGRSATMQETAV